MRLDRIPPFLDPWDFGSSIARLVLRPPQGVEAVPNIDSWRRLGSTIAQCAQVQCIRLHFVPPSPTKQHRPLTAVAYLRLGQRSIIVVREQKTLGELAAERGAAVGRGHRVQASPAGRWQ